MRLPPHARKWRVVTCYEDPQAKLRAGRNEKELEICFGWAELCGELHRYQGITRQSEVSARLHYVPSAHIREYCTATRREAEQRADTMQNKGMKCEPSRAEGPCVRS